MYKSLLNKIKLNKEAILRSIWASRGANERSGKAQTEKITHIHVDFLRSKKGFFIGNDCFFKCHKTL